MQRAPVWKIVFIVFTLLFSLWMLLPTLEFYSYDPLMRNMDESERIVKWKEQIAADGVDAASLDDAVKARNRKFRDLKSDAIRLGMDLQGGVHLVIEVDDKKYEARLRESLQNQGKTEDQIKSSVKYGLDTVLGSAVAVLESRVDSYGVSEVALVKQPPYRVVLEMPGVSEPERVKELVKADADLSFHIVADKNELGRLLPDIDSIVPEEFLALTPKVNPYMAAVAVEFPDNYLLVDEVINRPEVQRVIPRQLMFKWGTKKEPDDWYKTPYRYLYLLEKRTNLTGDQLQDAYVYVDSMNRPEVVLAFDSVGKRNFSNITGEHVRDYLAILMNDQVYSAPVIKERIRHGRANISGIDSFDEARQISVVLRAGGLPAPMEVAESRVVGPSLGADSINKGLYSGIIGGVLVLIFMVVYYGLVGAVADLAVILNLFFLLAGMAMFKATLTLPGIAGIVLTIGMAVDANVLIFERLREEAQGKRSKTVQLILDKGYGRAFMTIFDANLTTLITALVLFQFGTGPIKGFAVTLSLGIVISMFTAIFVTRVVLDVMVARGMKTLSLGSIHFFKNPQYQILKNAKILMLTTGGLAIAGFIFLIYDWDNMQGIDFAGGTEILIQFENETNEQIVRDSLKDAGFPDATVQKVLGSENQIMVRVKEGEVKEATVLADALQKALPEGSKFNDDYSSSSVGAKVGVELLLKGLYCILFSSLGILLYITVRFEFRFAVAAVICLFHDVLFTLAFLAITGTEFNLPIIAALLTVLGYSLNDTIVVFDRVRENYTSALLNFKEMVNVSINQTLSRTVITSLTTFIVVLVLHLFGGSVIHDFSFTLMIGVVIGTYSSIFVASPILLMMGHKAPDEAAKKKSKMAIAS